jgi:hypothetical protein
MKTLGQNPQANQIMAALQAHMAEHLGYQYRSQIEKQMGVTMPEPNKPLPPSVEVELSRLVAMASQQLLEMHKGQAAQQKAQEQEQDPLIQLQKADIQIKQQDAQRKAAKDQSDMQAKMAQIDLERMRIEQQGQLAQMKIQAEAESHALEDQQQMTLEKMRASLDAAKEKSRLNNQ